LCPTARSRYPFPHYHLPGPLGLKAAPGPLPLPQCPSQRPVPAPLFSPPRSLCLSQYPCPCISLSTPVPVSLSVPLSQCPSQYPVPSVSLSGPLSLCLSQYLCPCISLSVPLSQCPSQYPCPCISSQYPCPSVPLSALSRHLSLRAPAPDTVPEPPVPVWLSPGTGARHRVAVSSSHRCFCARAKPHRTEPGQVPHWGDPWTPQWSSLLLSSYIPPLLLRLPSPFYFCPFLTPPSHFPLPGLPSGERGSLGERMTGSPEE